MELQQVMARYQPEMNEEGSVQIRRTGLQEDVITKIDVSIIICTFNRSAFLADTLRTLTRSLSPRLQKVEILVVNNASTDDTNEVVKSFIESAPSVSLRLIHESRKGLSYARNTGLEQAWGDVLCFLDDDVIVPDGWLEGLLSAFYVGDTVGCVAGQIKLRFPNGPRPAWLDNKYNGLFGELALGDRPFLLSRGDDFFGGNFAITRKAASVVGSFNTDLGRKHYSLLSGEDTEYAKRLWENGFAIAYSGAGYIHHRVHAERLTYQWIARRYFWAGVTNSLMRTWFYFLGVLPRLLGSILLMLLGLLIGYKKRIVLSSFRIIHACGVFYGLLFKMKAIAQEQARPYSILGDTDDVTPGVYDTNISKNRVTLFR